jgi:hypothetical protein
MTEARAFRWRLRLIYLGLALLCIAVGLLLRWPALGMPWAVGKYGGSMLWAAMVYFGLRMLFPMRRALVIAVAAAIIAALGEMTQLISIPWFDAYRETTIGHLIFGRTFAAEDIVAYWIGIAVAAALDGFSRRSAAGRQGKPQTRSS